MANIPSSIFFSMVTIAFKKFDWRDFQKYKRENLAMGAKHHDLILFNKKS